MKRRKLTLLLALVSLFLVACGNKTNDTAEEVLDTESFNAVVQDGGFHINNKGKVVNVSDVKDQKVLEWYLEPRCPDCHVLEEETSPYLLDIMGDNTLIKYYPITFIGRSKDNPSLVTYSDDLSGLILSIAKNDPDIAYPFLQKVVTQLYATLNYENSKRMEAFQATYKELGGTKWDQVYADIKSGTKIALDKTNALRTDEELISKTPNNRIATPLLYLVGEEKAFGFIGSTSDQIREELEKRLK